VCAAESVQTVCGALIAQVQEAILPARPSQGKDPVVQRIDRTRWLTSFGPTGESGRVGT